MQNWLLNWYGINHAPEVDKADQGQIDLLKVAVRFRL